LQCACLPPDTWPYDDVPAAPYCDNLTGQPKYLSGERCTDGLECRSSTFPEQGCHCRERVWQCGTSDDVSARAPSCESFGNGLQAVLSKQPCGTPGVMPGEPDPAEWQLCIARDYNDTGTSPRGCVCMMDGAQLLWKCGATNRWYRAE
jgi:hypothetical protein